MIRQALSSLRSYGVARTCSLVWRTVASNEAPVLARPWLATHGYKPVSYRVYGFGDKPKGARRDYLSDTGRTRLAAVNAESGRFLRNKLVFHRMMEHAGMPAPDLVAFVRRGEIIRAPSPHDVMTIDDLDGDFFLKPIGSGKGNGVHRIGNGDIRALTEVLKHSGDEHLIVRTAEPAPYSREIYSGSFNTIRAVAMREPRSREVFFPRAVHRFGAEGTGPVDNWSRGGLSCDIDIESGVMGSGVRHPSCTDGALLSYDRHPDTQAHLAGVEIPCWREGLELLRATMDVFPDIEYAGWDLLATPDGWCIIEGNEVMDVDLLQVHRPLLSDGLIREFIAHHCPAALR